MVGGARLSVRGVAGDGVDGELADHTLTSPDGHSKVGTLETCGQVGPL